MNIRYLAALLLVATSLPAMAEPGDTTRVRAFEPYLWVNHGGQNRWVDFPDSIVRHEKILMRLRLECPAAGCGEWDYTMNIYVQRRTGLRDSAGNEIIEPIEIGRFITPYGKYYRQGRVFEWIYDVTDYASLLHDSVEIRTFYDGWSQGSIYSLDFDFIEGIPTRDVLRVETLYNGRFSYGNVNDPIETHLPERSINVDAWSSNTTLKITTTGHGFGGTENAAEFSNKTHKVLVNGQERYRQHLWRDDCGQNPVYPQAGTWYYNRAGWCPGDVVHPDFFDLTPFVTPGQSATVDYNMQPYVNLDLSHGASYIVQAQVLYATGPNFVNNVALESVRRPSTEFRYRRMNPICDEASPIVVIRNSGSAPLTRATFMYGVEGGTQHRYDWTGNLSFMQTADVELPPFDQGNTSGRFVVTVSEPNGVADEYVRDNAITTSFNLPKRTSTTLFLSMRTDDFFDDAAETTNGISWQVIDASGTVVRERDGFADRTIYRDTLRLTDGCYRFIIRDEHFGDGLIPIRGTPGNYTLRDDKGVTVINGAANGPDYFAGFGDREVTSFIVSSVSDADADDTESDIEGINLYPNPSDGTFQLDFDERVARATIDVTVSNVSGYEVMRRAMNTGARTMPIDLGEQPNGTYLVRVRSDAGTWLRKIIVAGR